MNAKSVTLHPVLTCNEDTKVSEIARKMEEKNERRIFVNDSEGNLVGIVTSTDLVYKVIAEERHDLKAKDVMVSNVETIDINDELEKALKIMNNLKIFVCPVVKDKKIMGLVDYHDIVNFIFECAHKD